LHPGYDLSARMQSHTSKRKYGSKRLESRKSIRRCGSFF